MSIEQDQVFCFIAEFSSVSVWQKQVGSDVIRPGRYSPINPVDFIGQKACGRGGETPNNLYVRGTQEKNCWQRELWTKTGQERIIRQSATDTNSKMSPAAPSR